MPDKSDNPNSTAESTSPATAEPVAPPVRAFAQGTGVLLQMVGMTLFLSSCCVCSMSGLWDPPMGRYETQEKLNTKQIEPSTPMRPFADLATTGLTLTVVFTTLGGLAMAVFGLGLQSDKPRAGWAAVLTTTAYLIIMIAAAICLWAGGASLVPKVWNLVLTLIALILLGFSVVALRQVLRHPPPPGMDILPPDFEIPKFKH